MVEKKFLPRDYTAVQMDRGEGMKYHPHDCRILKEKEGSLEFIKSEAAYCFQPGIYKWMAHERWLLPRIGNGKPHRAGDPYPAHWRFCPFTGERLPWPSDNRD